MIETIKLSHIPSKAKQAVENLYFERFNVSMKDTSDDIIEESFDYSTELFSEAVFTKGKETVKPIEEQFQAVKDELNSQIEKHESDPKSTFNPGSFVKHAVWKELEDRMVKIFGFRNVEIMHFNEKYFAKTKDFETKVLNCYTYTSWRYPIDGLVSDKGFFDSTRSINCTIVYSLGMIKELSAAELFSIFLHELGHNIDPALVDITYKDSNDLSKYITENRKPESKDGKPKGFIEILIFLGFIGIYAALVGLFTWISNLFFNKDKALSKLRDFIKSSKNTYNRKTNTEAFADNLPRMYGYGSAFMSAFAKIDKKIQEQLKSRIKNEKYRQRLMIDCVKWAMADVHQTDLHRAHALIKEYESDLADPNIPEKIKKDIKADLDEFKKFVDLYINQNDEFTNRVNKMILEELEKMDAVNVKKDAVQKLKNSRNIKQDLKKFEFNNTKELKESSDKDNDYKLTKEDYDEIKKHFGNKHHECSFKKDKDGYYCHTHRARSKSVPSISKITKKDYDFICSTS